MFFLTSRRVSVKSLFVTILLTMCLSIDATYRALVAFMGQQSYAHQDEFLLKKK